MTIPDKPVLTLQEVYHIFEQTFQMSYPTFHRNHRKIMPFFYLSKRDVRITRNDLIRYLSMLKKNQYTFKDNLPEHNA